MSLMRERPPGKGQWRLSLPQERHRRVRDASEQPRNPVGWWRPLTSPRARRAPVSGEDRQWYEERDDELRQEEQALRADLASHRVARATDRLDQGRRVSVRELQRHHAKRLNAYGRPTAEYDRYAGNVEAHSRAADAARDTRARLAAVQTERRSLHEALVYGTLPRSAGEWRRRWGR